MQFKLWGDQISGIKCGDFIKVTMDDSHVLLAKVIAEKPEFYKLETIEIKQFIKPKEESRWHPWKIGDKLIILHGDKIEVVPVEEAMVWML